MLTRSVHNLLSIIITYGDNNLLAGRTFSNYVDPRPRYARIVED